MARGKYLERRFRDLDAARDDCRPGQRSMGSCITEHMGFNLLDYRIWIRDVCNLDSRRVLVGTRAVGAGILVYTPTTGALPRTNIQQGWDGDRWFMK